MLWYICSFLFWPSTMRSPISFNPLLCGSTDYGIYTLSHPLTSSFAMDTLAHPDILKSPCTFWHTP